jgi:hypothetical protein
MPHVLIGISDLFPSTFHRAQSFSAPIFNGAGIVTPYPTRNPAYDAGQA